MNKISITEQKKIAAERAAEFVKSGMTIGLGTGSTFQFALEKIAQKLKSGELKNIVGVPTSNNTASEANRLGVPVITLDEAVVNAERRMKSSKFGGRNSTLCIDIAIDGADEVDKNLNLIKGGGGALLKEKIVASASKELIIAIDETKLSNYLGEKFFVPVEVVPFAKNYVEEVLKSMNAETKVRKNKDGSDYLTDQKNIIIDAKFGVIKNPEELALKLSIVPGIVEHGLFIGMAAKVVYCCTDGVKVLGRS